MTPKERAAMQQALEALENERSHMTANWDNIVKAITALREALDHSGEANEMVAMNLNCKSVQARLATLWGYVKAEQAEQEPVAEVHNTDTPSNWSIIKPGLPAGTKLYAAPVRTKDLTDNEINKISNTIANAMPANMTVEDWKRSFARAVIAADREKNK